MILIHNKTNKQPNTIYSYFSLKLHLEIVNYFHVCEIELLLVFWENILYSSVEIIIYKTLGILKILLVCQNRHFQNKSWTLNSLTILDPNSTYLDPTWLITITLLICVQEAQEGSWNSKLKLMSPKKTLLRQESRMLPWIQQNPSQMIGLCNLSYMN